jgi:hypothetical protein
MKSIGNLSHLVETDISGKGKRLLLVERATPYVQQKYRYSYNKGISIRNVFIFCFIRLYQ